MVTSAVSATIPTGEKSPYTIIFSGVYVVRLDGDRYGYDTDSFYGNWSPSTRSTSASYVHFVYSYGDVTGYGEYNFSDYSHGNIFDYFCI